MKRTLSMILALIMLIMTVPGAVLAESEDISEGKTQLEQTETESKKTNTQETGLEDNNTSAEANSEEEKATETPEATATREPEVTPKVTETPVATEKPAATDTPKPQETPKPMLIASGGTFPYDGKKHVVSAKVENAQGYSIEFSKDEKTWSKDALGLTKVGKLTVKVRALKSGADTLYTEVTLEITGKDVQIVTIVNCKNSVNVRKGPSSSTAKIGNAPKGAKYTLLEVDGKWYKIQYKNNVTGYVFIDYIKMGEGMPDEDEQTPSTDPTGKTVTIINCKTACNVRKGGNTSTAKIGTAPKGAKYQYLGKSGNYYKIQYTASKIGYVHKSYAKVTNESVEPDQEETSSKKIVTIVNCKVNCNVRAKASQSSQKLGVAPRDKKYQYLGKSGNYYKIQFTKGKVGYVSTSYAKISNGTVTPDSDAKSPDQGTIVNCKTMVNVRAAASSNSKLLGTLKLGATVVIVKNEGNWTKIKYNGGEAYVFSKYIKKG